MEIRDAGFLKEEETFGDELCSLNEKEPKAKTFSRKFSDTLRKKSSCTEKVSRRSSAPNTRKNTDKSKQNVGMLANKENNNQAINQVLTTAKKCIADTFQRKNALKNDDTFKFFDDAQNASNSFSSITNSPSKEKMSKRTLKLLIGSKALDDCSLIMRNECLLNAPGIICSKRLLSRHTPLEGCAPHTSFDTIDFAQHSLLRSYSSTSLDIENQFDFTNEKGDLNLDAKKKSDSFVSENESKKKINNFNLFLIGSKSVGKTESVWCFQCNNSPLTVRFLTGRYIHEYMSMPAEVYSRRVSWNEQSVGVEITDKDVESLNEDIELNKSSGVMILYSIVDRTSFVTANILLKHLYDHSITHSYPVLLIGTKRDLSRRRLVTRAEGLHAAHRYNCTYTEVSAADNVNVKNSFQKMFAQIEGKQLFIEHGDSSISIIEPLRILRNFQQNSIENDNATEVR